MWDNDNQHDCNGDLEADQVAETKPEPHVDLRRLKAGTVVLCNTNKDVFELKLIDPILLVVAVTGTEARFKNPVRGQFIGSFTGYNRCDTRYGCIVKDGKMTIGFRETQVETSPILSAKVCGHDWAFNVF